MGRTYGIGTTLGACLLFGLASGCSDEATPVAQAAERATPTPEVIEPEPEPDPLEARELSEGLVVDRLQSGAGRRRARVGDRLIVHYTVRLASSEELLEDTREGGIPYSFELGVGEVIDAWDRGLIGARQGEQVRIEAPAATAWGGTTWGSVPADADLVFELEVFRIDR